jgi:NHL repeat-containing protein/PKD domain-containing protein
MTRSRPLCLAAALLLSHAVFGQYTVERYGGPDRGEGYTDGNGKAARFSWLRGTALDAAGNLYASDYQNTIRKVAPDERVSTLAGLAGVTGSADGRGAAARFNSLWGVALDGGNNLYVADNLNDSIRRITPIGDVTTFVDIPKPLFLAFDSLGNLFVTCDDHVVRKVTPAGVISVVAGEVGLLGNPPRLRYPAGIAVDTDDNVYVIDTGNRVLRKITPAGTVSVVSYTPSQYPWALTYDGHGALHMSAAYSFFKLGLDGTKLSETTIASSQTDGPLGTATFFHVTYVQPAPDGDLYLCDGATIRRISNSVVTTIAGEQNFGSSSLVDGPRQTASFGLASAAVYDSHGNLFIGEGWAIRKITPAGDVSMFASDFGFIADLAIDSSNNLYVADEWSHVIQKVSPIGSIEILAGKVDEPGFRNGFRGEARFNIPGGLTLDSAGNVYVSDYDNHQIRKITPAGEVSTFAGSLTVSSGDADGTGTTARFSGPWGIDIDASGNLYVAEFWRPRIRKITTPGAVVSTFAGSTTRGVVDATGTDARFMYPMEMQVDTTGMYVSDHFSMLRKISFAGEVTTLAGVDAPGASVEGTGSIARFKRIEAIASDGNGNLIIGDNQAGAFFTAKPPGITDQATASSTTPAMYSTVQLGTNTNTATKWTWSILHRPAGSTAELSATNIRNPTFIPDVAGDRFILMLRAENASGVRYSTVELEPADTCTPLSSAIITMNGDASVCTTGTGGTASVATVGGGELTYQWGWRATSDGETHSIPNATLSMYTLDGTDFGGIGAKFLVVTVTSSCGTSITSSPLSVTLHEGLTNLAITVPLPVYASNDAQTASVADAGFGAEYLWSITNGTIVSGQGTRTIRFAAGATGNVELHVTITKLGCPETGSISVPVTPGAMLYVITPCRVIDTRNSTLLAASTTREVTFANVCGVPADAKSVAVNTTAVSPSAAGWLALYGAGIPWPGVSSLSYRTGRTRASSGVVKLSPDGKLVVKNGGPAVHFIIDVTGYFK